MKTMPAVMFAFFAAFAPVTAQEQKWVAPRTSDDHPDMQGAWARRGTRIQEAQGPASPLGEFSSTGQPYPTIFNTGVATSPDRAALASRQTGLVDPPDRVLPWRPEADAARREYMRHMIPPASLKYVEPAARCVLPGPVEGDDRSPFFILQRPGSFVLAYEYNHVTRVIYTDGRPHAGNKVRFFMGDSIGRWEGDTLVVDTTNFNDKTSLGQSIPFHSGDLHTTERLTMLSPNVIDYVLTLEDPKLFTRPIKVAGYFEAAQKGTEPMEFACAEGSQTLPNVFGFEFAPVR
jgi:hypothetical protein